MARNTSRKTLYLHLETDLLAKVDALAAEGDRTRTAQVRRMLIRELERLTAVKPASETTATSENASAA